VVLDTGDERPEPWPRVALGGALELVARSVVLLQVSR